MLRYRYPVFVLAAFLFAGAAGFPLPVHAQAAGSDSVAVTAEADSMATPIDSVSITPVEPPKNWFNLDEQEDRFRGVSTERVYHELLNGQRPQKSVVVAVIDGGVDITHEDLDDRIWTNPGEIPGNGVDDDHNGYVDDVHGWNFIGGADGRDVDYDTMELTREYARLRDKYERADSSVVPSDGLGEFKYYLKIKADFEAQREETAEQLQQIDQAEAGVREAVRIVKEFLDTDSLTKDQLMGLNSIRQDVLNARGFLLYLDANGITPEIIAEEKARLQHSLDYSFNPGFNPRDIVGDHYADSSERYYGNNDVAGPDPGHGTTVAGVIAAERGNGLGIDGIADSVRIMVVRTVPNGDERDKDVANAIRYAVDNGARIVNMSFGKSYSPQKEAVDAAVRYAQEEGVLLIHAAGNDGADIDSTANFPTKEYLNGTGTADNWIEVGASSFAPGADFVAYWSNYGQEVDVFAPGVAIYSTAPGQSYRTTQGTSLSAPVVTGVAALITSYFPQFTAAQVRDIILRSAVRYPGEQVDIPGTGEFQVDFSQLSATGGVVNAYNALKLAREMATQQ